MACASCCGTTGVGAATAVAVDEAAVAADEAAVAADMLGALAAALLRSGEGATVGGGLKRFAPGCADATGGGIVACR